MNLEFKKLKYYFLSGLFFLFSLPATAQTIRERLKRVGVGDEVAGYKDISEGEGDLYFAETLGALIRTVLTFLGVIFLILMIYGGFMWMTAEGNNDKVEKAKKIITNSTIGLVIIMLSYAISWFVIYKLGEATEFDPGL